NSKNSRIEKPKHKWEKFWQERTLVRIESEIFKKGIPIPHTFLTLEELLAPCKQSRARKTIQRPQNDYVIYRKEVSAELSINYPNTHFQDVSRIASQRWNSEAQEKRNFFTILAFVGNLIHADVFPDYHNSEVEIPSSANSDEKLVNNCNNKHKIKRQTILDFRDPIVSDPRAFTHQQHQHQHREPKQEKNEEHEIHSSKSSSSSPSSPTRASAFRLVKQKSSSSDLLRCASSSSLRKPPHSFTPYPIVRKIPIKVISSCSSSSNDIKSSNETTVTSSTPSSASTAPSSPMSIDDTNPLHTLADIALATDI
ncbi:8827_t:CDS:2, partial [Ambispora gerdemannii]